MLNGKEKLVERVSARQFPSFQCENTAAAGFVARKFITSRKDAGGAKKTLAFFFAPPASLREALTGAGFAPAVVNCDGCCDIRLFQFYAA
jgi:hypothetical protein